jgi:hypothetical protein
MPKEILEGEGIVMPHEIHAGKGMPQKMRVQPQHVGLPADAVHDTL